MKRIGWAVQNFNEELFKNMTAADVGTVVRCTGRAFQLKDLEKDAEYLGLTKEEPINSISDKKSKVKMHVTKHCPVWFSWKKIETVNGRI